MVHPQYTPKGHGFFSIVQEHSMVKMVKARYSYAILTSGINLHDEHLEYLFLCY